MDKDALFLFFCLGGSGGLILTLGVLSRLGILRGIYAVKGHRVLMPRGHAFVGIPLGICILSLCILLLIPIEPESRGDIALYILGPGILFTYVVAIWQPSWLKPAWLRWLEKEHGDIIELLWEDAREKKWKWEREVRTQKDLEEWVRQVRSKHEWLTALSENSEK